MRTADPSGGATGAALSLDPPTTMITATPSADHVITTAPAAPRRRIADISEALTVGVDADPVAVLTAVRRLDHTRTVTRALRALGLADRISLMPTVLDRGRGPDPLVLGLIWRLDAWAPAASVSAAAFDGFDRRGHVKVTWRIDAEPSSTAGGSVLSVATRITATDDDAHDRLLEGWALAGPMLRGVARRLAQAVRAHAEHDEADW